MVGLSIALKRFAYSASSADVPLYLSFALWLCYMIYEGVCSAIARQQDLVVHHEGKRFRALGLDMYVCPKLRKRKQAQASAPSPGRVAANADPRASAGNEVSAFL